LPLSGFVSSFLSARQKFTDSSPTRPIHNTQLQGLKELGLSNLPHRYGRVPRHGSIKFAWDKPLLRVVVALLILGSILALGYARSGFAQGDGVVTEASPAQSRNKIVKPGRRFGDDLESITSDSPNNEKHLQPESVPGEILVRFRKNAEALNPGNQLELATVGTRVDIPVEFERLAAPEIMQGLRLARVAPAETERAIEALRARADVLYAEHNYIRYAQKIPNDPRFGEMWGLKNTGQPATSGGNPGTPGIDIHAEQAWDITTGSKTVVVGVIDEGIDINHEDLTDNIWTNPGEVPNNGVDDDANGYIDDVNGWDFAHNDNTVFDYTEPAYPPASNYSGDVEDHGTHVAGTIGAQGNNGKGVVGVNWQVSLMSLKFLTGPDGIGTSADLLKAYGYARSMRELWNSSGGIKGANIRVLNNSYGGGGFSQAELEAIRALGDAGILFVVAAGNDGSYNDRFPTYPANYLSTNLISVAASTGAGVRAAFSNSGSGTVHMTAPGVHILSTTPRNTYDFFSGTSMSTPHVAGGAALLCAAYPNIALSKLRSVILYSGDVAPWQYFGGYPIATGRGLSANKALEAVVSTDAVSPAAVSQFKVYNSSFPKYGLAWTAPGDDGNTGKVAAYQVRYSESDLSDPSSFDLATPLPGPVPGVSGTGEIIDLQVPWRHTPGFIGVRAIDEVGNAGPISTVPLSVSLGVGDPYVVAESAPTSLSTGGTPLGLIADDEYKQFRLPFGFKFFEGTTEFVSVSSNGLLYFGIPPGSGGTSEDFNSSINLLDGYSAIAGAWDDLRTDKRAGDDVYVVTPDPDRIIFRWQAVTYDTPMSPGVSRGEHPVNFEIELQINGTVILRYGDGNEKLLPIVGLGGGWPDPYVVASHTSGDEFKDLTNAGTVTFSLRNPPALPTADLALSMRNGPDPVSIGGEETYEITVRNYGPNTATSTVVTDALPTGLTFVSCTTKKGSCTGPAKGSSGTVTVNAGELESSREFIVQIVVQVNASPGNISNTVSVSSSRFDAWPGNNTASATAQVFAFPAFGDVSKISSAYFMNLALKQDGSVWAWGQNDTGALGNGYQGLPMQQNSPIPVNNLSGVTAVSTGGPHCLALKSDGTVWAWGSNYSGESGGADFQAQTPAVVNGLSSIVAVAAGNNHSLALRSDGTVWAWGANSVGQLGLGTIDSNSHPTPVAVPGLSDVTFITAGPAFNVVVRKDGTVWTWGQNQNGQLGSDGAGKQSPAQVSGVSDVKSVAVSFNHVLALRNDGTVMGWGMNAFGQTGSNNFVNVNPTPAFVNGLSGVSAIAGGYGFSLALKSDGTIWGWGLNAEGQLANGTTGSNPQPNPTLISEVGNAVSIAAGNSHGLALLADGTLRAWGSNYYGQLGSGTNFTRTTPVQVNTILVVAQPTMVPGNFTAPGPIMVTVSTNTGGAIIHYTVNGQDPTESDPTVESGSSLAINQDLTLKARAFKSGWIPSPVATAIYDVLTPPPAEWETVIWTAEQVSQMKAWTVGGKTYIYVVPKFPDAGYRVLNWGQVIWDGANFSTEVVVQRHVGTAVQAVTTTAHIYELEPLATGNSNFIIKNSYDRSVVKSLAFTVGASSQPNPIDEQRQFVRQQYLDFLNREPDGPGWDHWTGEITECTTDPSKRFPGETEAACIVRKRANTSAAFFLSPEFQNTGYFVLRVYRGSLGRMPYFGGSIPADNNRDEFTRDHAAVSAGIVVNNQLDQAVIYSNRLAFVNQFVSRPDFLAIYGNLSNQEYVDKLFATTAIAPTSTERQSLVDGLANGTETRASVLYKIVDGSTTDGVVTVQTRYGRLFYEQQSNPGFVQMEYFGYMRRDPDEAGFAFWLNKLNQYGGNFVDAQMVMAFVQSPEYRARFGQP
jgi:uncharacterized repeat protein (TIGR01451 family)